MFLAGLALAAPTSTQEAGETREEVVRLEAWPELSRDQAKTVKTDISRLRKARTEEMGDQAHEALVAVGAGCAPDLIVALGKEKGEEARDRIVNVLDLVTGAPHTRLLARSFDDKSVNVRIWCGRRAALFPDPGIRAAADEALARVSKSKQPARGEVAAAALAATSAGSTEGLNELFEHAVKNWGKYGKSIRIACDGVRGEAANAMAVGYLTGTDERAERVAAIRLLGGCGTEEGALQHLRPLLDSNDSTLRIATINALRGIVDDEMPLARLSVFDSIEQAKTWKQRIR